QVDVLIEAAADRDQQAPQRDVIRHTGVADRAKEHGVEPLQLLEAILRHHAAGLRINLATPVEMSHLVREAEFFSRRFDHPQAFRHHLVADAIPFYNRDFECGHSDDSISTRLRAWRYGVTRAVCAVDTAG